MQESLAFFVSTFLHFGVAFVAANYTYALIDQEPEPLYAVELIAAPAVEKSAPNIVSQIQKTKNKSKKKTVKKKVVTQKQESPVKVEVKKEVAEQIKEEVAEPEVIAVDEMTDARLLQQQVGNPVPAYSRKDRLAHRAGRVVVIGYVNQRGTVEQVQLVESTGSEDMNRNSVNAFSKYRFKQNQPGWVKMPYEFKIEGQAKVLGGLRDRTQFKKLRN